MHVVYISNRLGQFYTHQSTKLMIDEIRTCIILALFSNAKLFQAIPDGVLVKQPLKSYALCRSLISYTMAIAPQICKT